MRKIFFAIALIPLLSIGNMAMAVEGWVVGLSAGQLGAYAVGSVTEDGPVANKEDHSESGAFYDDVGSIFVEADLGRVSLGVDVIFSKVATPENKNIKNGSTNYASAEFSDIITMYGTVDVIFGLYLKAGLISMNVETTERMNTDSSGSVVGDENVNGYTAGVGYKYETDGGLQFRIEALAASYDAMSATGSNGSSYAVNDMLSARGHISIAKTF